MNRIVGKYIRTDGYLIVGVNVVGQQGCVCCMTPGHNQ